MQAACFSGVIPAKSCQRNKFDGVQMPKDITKIYLRKRKKNSYLYK